MRDLVLVLMVTTLPLVGTDMFKTTTISSQNVELVKESLNRILF